MKSNKTIIYESIIKDISKIIKNHLNESIKSNIGKEIFYLLAGDKLNVKDSNVNKSIIKALNDYCIENDITSLNELTGPYILPQHAIKNSTAWDDGFLNADVFKFSRNSFSFDLDGYWPEDEDSYFLGDKSNKSNKINYEAFVSEHYIGLDFAFFQKIKGKYECNQTVKTFFYFKRGSESIHYKDKIESEYLRNFDMY